MQTFPKGWLGAFLLSKSLSSHPVTSTQGHGLAVLSLVSERHIPASRRCRKGGAAENLDRESTPGQEKRFPRSFDGLLEDRRLAVPRRHLRRIYANPATGTPDWYVVRAPDGGISEVRSRP